VTTPPMSQVVVITGASAGVGRALARVYGARGARVGLMARGHEGLEAARREIEEAGGSAIVLPLDVADADAVEAAADRVEQELGPIDLWINNAMVSVFSPVRETTAEEYRRVTEVTYLGYVHGTLAALRRMLPRDRGTIAQVGSALAYRGIPLQSAYCAAKHAIVGFTDSLRAELIHDGSNVRITDIHLPAVNTPQFRWVKTRLPNKAQPVPPIFQVELIAETIAWFADRPDFSREPNIGWPAVQVIWGHKLAPSLVDRYLASSGFESQQTDEPDDPDRLHNLWDPVPGDAGARGVFDDRAITSHWQIWLNQNRHLVGAAAAAVGLVAIVSGWGLRRS
jgi:NAD(P)-dependent dehydrogenase (short-subunit alcohol dehydrogenase family)